MTPNTGKVHDKFKLNGVNYTSQDLKQVALNLIKEGESYEKANGSFLLEWLNDKDYIIVNTSGSTGKPKAIKLKKQVMVNSAIATGAFFNLKPVKRILHCLPSDYIAGKMMLVRALVLGLEVTTIAPKVKLTFDRNINYDFCALIPLQVPDILQQEHNIDTIIIGGSKIPLKVLELIGTSNSKCYETYGMTETITHVALRQLQSNTQQVQQYFTALPNVSFRENANSCLVIDAPKINDELVETNDIVRLKSKTQFKLLGRFDNVINSGGKKIHPEVVESKLQSIINDRFLIASEKDETLGEKVILIIESKEGNLEQVLTTIRKLDGLDKHEMPKEVYYTSYFDETPTGKINRSKTIKRVLTSV